MSDISRKTALATLIIEITNKVETMRYAALIAFVLLFTAVLALAFPAQAMPCV